MDKNETLLKVQGVSKDFDGNVVLKDVNFELGKGKILGLVGENGAGKSTLMKIIFGMSVIAETGGYKGDIYFDGEKINFKTPFDALNSGIGMTHQEFSLIPGFSASENILLNREKTKRNVVSSIFGKNYKTLDMKKMDKNSAQAIERLGVDIKEQTLIQNMPVAHKEFIEIAREINRDKVKMIILDEPTAVLTESEADILLGAIEKLAKEGVSIIFISHRLHEIKRVCDKIIVLRDGMIMAEKDNTNRDTSIDEIANLMVGRKLDTQVQEKSETKKSSEEIIMNIENLWVDMPGETIKNLNLKVKRGEILGIGGLAGQGKLGLGNGIMGLFPSGGKIIFENEEMKLNDPLTSLDKGIAFVSEDRRGVGLLLDEPIYWNITFNAMMHQGKYLKKVMGMRFRDDVKMKEVSQKYIDELEIRCTGPTQKVRNLSGGNQQKVSLAKAFEMEPKLLIVSEPTRGIDVGAKKLVLDNIRKYNEEKNATVIIISSELEELRSISDRIAIVCEGEVFGILPATAQAKDFGLLMSGEFRTNEAGERI